MVEMYSSLSWSSVILSSNRFMLTRMSLRIINLLLFVHCLQEKKGRKNTKDYSFICLYPVFCIVTVPCFFLMLGHRLHFTKPACIIVLRLTNRWASCHVCCFVFLACFYSQNPLAMGGRQITWRLLQTQLLLCGEMSGGRAAAPMKSITCVPLDVVPLFLAWHPPEDTLDSALQSLLFIYCWRSPSGKIRAAQTWFL